MPLPWKQLIKRKGERGDEIICADYWGNGLSLTTVCDIIWHDTANHFNRVFEHDIRMGSMDPQGLHYTSCIGPVVFLHHRWVSIFAYVHSLSHSLHSCVQILTGTEDSYRQDYHLSLMVSLLNSHHQYWVVHWLLCRNVTYYGFMSS